MWRRCARCDPHSHEWGFQVASIGARSQLEGRSRTMKQTTNLPSRKVVNNPHQRGRQLPMWIVRLCLRSSCPRWCWWRRQRQPKIHFTTRQAFYPTCFPSAMYYVGIIILQTRRNYRTWREREGERAHNTWNHPACGSGESTGPSFAASIAASIAAALPLPCLGQADMRCTTHALILLSGCHLLSKG